MARPCWGGRYQPVSPWRSRGHPSQAWLPRTGSSSTDPMENLWVSLQTVASKSKYSKQRKVYLDETGSTWSCLWLNSKYVTAANFVPNSAHVVCLTNFVFFLKLVVKNLQFEDGKMIPASKFFSSGESSSVELTDEEKKMAAEIKARNESSADSF